MIAKSTYINKHRIYGLVTIWFILTQTLPFFNLFVPVPMLYQYPIFLFFSLILFPELFFKRSLICLYVFLFFAFLLHFLGNAFYFGIGTITKPLFFMTGALVIAEYTIKYDKDYKYTKMVVFIVILANSVMTFLSYPQIVIFPNVIRYTFSMEHMDDYIDQAPWLITYQTCHGLSLLMAPLAFMIRKSFHVSNTRFIFYLFITIVLFSIIYLSNATTALIIAIMLLLMGFLIRNEKLNNKRITTFAVACLVLGLLSTSKSVMIPLLEGLQSTMDERSSNYGKIEEFKHNLRTGEREGDMGEREQLYSTSLELFISSPIIGTNEPERISNHSWFFDRLACHGIFFIIPLILLFVNHVNLISRSLVHSKVAYTYSIIGWFMLLMLKNDFDYGSWLYGFAILPLLCRYLDYLIDYKLKKVYIRK